MNVVEEMYKEIKKYVGMKENPEDDFNLYPRENGLVEFWVKSEEFSDVLVSAKLTEKEYDQLAYKIYKHRLDVYIHRQ